MAKSTIYAQLIAGIFNKYYIQGATTVDFHREELPEMAATLGLSVAKNLGDILYSFRYRRMLPDSILELAPEGMEWVIRSTPGLHARYNPAVCLQ